MTNLNLNNLHKILPFLLSLTTLFLSNCNKVVYFQDNLEFKQQQNFLIKQAEGYLKSAELANDDLEKNKHLLNGAELLINANDIARAKLILTKIDQANLNHTLYATWKILLAQISLSENNLTEAKNLILAVGNYNNLNHEIYKKLYLTKIKIFQKTGESLEAIQEQINLERYLNTNQELNNNHKAIWEQLQELSPSFLATINHQNFSYVMQGWLTIAKITKQYDTETLELTKAIQEWQQNFPNHPANYILDLQHKALNSQYDLGQQNIISNFKSKQLNKIALLLPLSGPYKKSGIAIKNGFLAASYNKKTEHKPEIIIIDTNQYAINNINKQIQQDNIDLIVGPLIKEDLEKISKFNKIPIPIIALNTIENVNNHGLFLFGLPPESEGQAIIEKARDNRYKNALLIVENNEFGKRISNSIVNNWKLIGNNIIDIMSFNNSTDINKSLKISLGIEDSNQRAKSLSSLGIKFNFDPRRRQDIDCIFLITNAAHARQIKPLLNFYYASKVPIYAISNIYTGVPNPSLDRDLDGIQFCDLPWMLDNSIANSNIYQVIKKLWKESFASAPRLYALGIDAYKLANQIELLVSMPEIGISGMTGMLKLNQENIITRKLMWGTFENGLPVVLNQKN